jgi:hypothetical protein
MLGLRHNFKGSNFAATKSSSVMDYLDPTYMAINPLPAAYDRDAIQFLYGNRQKQPAQAFCTDEDTFTDPFCRRFDSGVNPLQAQILPEYRDLIDSYLATQDPDILSGIANAMQNALDFVQAGPSPQQMIAWEALLKSI